MGLPVLIYGKSGSGKSRSLKNFAKDEIALINVESKALPFKGKFDLTMNDAPFTSVVIQALEKLPENINTIVIDDAGYLMSHYFMAKHRDMKGNAQFEMYNQIADDMCALIKTIKAMPENKIVYLIFHEDTNDYNETKLFTIGKLLDQKANLVGMVTICLRCMSADGKHFFKTVTDGSDVTKAPEEMFEAEEIPNDLKAVDVAIREYYEI